MRQLLLCLALLPLLVFGQTYYYIDAISVYPPEPTTNDEISITLHGNLSSSGAYIVSSSAMLMGNMVHITVIAADPGGLAVLVPHDEEIALGLLPAGDYTIMIDGTAVMDMAPSPEHLFTVTTGGPPCDNLDITSVQWHAFTDTAIVIHAVNSDPGQELFDFPSFILLDMNGDTLAKETVNAFGIGEDSWHFLRVMDGVAIPSGPFPGFLDLWTDMGTVLACSWEMTFDLCPPEPCATLIASVQNYGGALAIGSYSYSLLDEDFEQVAAGVLTMVDTVQFDYDTLCVAPGHYSMSLGPNDPPTGGQPVFGVQVDHWITGPSAPVSWSLPVPIEFDFYMPCAEGTNGIADREAAQGLVVIHESGGITLSRRDGIALGPIDVFDVQGRALYHGSSASNSTTIDLQTFESGVLLIRAADLITRTVIVGH